MLAHSMWMCTNSMLPCCLAGGDLRLISMPGYGVDAFLTIQHLEGEWEEQRVEPQAIALENEFAAAP